MHRNRARVLAVASAAALMAIGVAGPAAAHGGHGGGKPAPPPFSIQAAVDAAKPGATIHIPPGTYHESVTITKDGISLRGYDVVIKPRAGALPTLCDDPENPARVSGICIPGDVTFSEEAPPVVNDAVRGVSVRGVTVQGFTGDGLIGLGTKDLSVRDSKFKDNGGYGAASFVTEGTTFRDNKALRNVEAGFYVGDSPRAKADVRGNYSAENELGFFFRNASVGKAQGNVAVGNCVGMLLLAGAPGPVVGWDVKDNKVAGNNKVCAGNPDDGIPPLSGAGIVLAGAQDFRVRGNAVSDNASNATSLVEGGIVVLSTDSAPGVLAPGFDPSGSVKHNWAKGNQPADINWDGQGMVRFDHNRCRTSIPAGLCR
ncbi:MAG: right-handed parallel beta-helix repeat-containing protein [Blastococcus sp.]|nr:right-handed parallel beta-helix repeat-containing protein [Blastococcus sp.]